jgi:hypothetical protein
MGKREKRDDSFSWDMESAKRNLQFNADPVNPRRIHL